jgi:hypothetical protein
MVVLRGTARLEGVKAARKLDLLAGWLVGRRDAERQPATPRHGHSFLEYDVRS